MSSKEKSEDQLGRQWDKFISNSVLKMGSCLPSMVSSVMTGTGVIIGSVFSLLVFRRRVWPLVFGSGI
ncbi:unnamed protein product, partial [Oppiella nova]